jgi:hypothetical protein
MVDARIPAALFAQIGNVKFVKWQRARPFFLRCMMGWFRYSFGQ